MTKTNWDESIELDKLAELSIKTGVALQPGQDLLVTAPLEAAPLVRRLAYHAYNAGAGLVTPFYNDPEVPRGGLFLGGGVSAVEIFRMIFRNSI